MSYNGQVVDRMVFTEKASSAIENGKVRKNPSVSKVSYRRKCKLMH